MSAASAVGNASLNGSGSSYNSQAGRSGPSLMNQHERVQSGNQTASGTGSYSGKRVISQSSIASSGTGNSGRTSYGGIQPSSSGAAHMESTVTKLLVATKQLLEGLTDWSQGRISEEQVSDIYVRLGNCFNAAVAAFTKEGISMKDLKEVPALLRVRLEAAINEEASATTLNEHLPKIRPIILDLLRGLREKQDQHQAMMAASAGREQPYVVNSHNNPQQQPANPPPPPRQGSLSGQSNLASNYRARQQSSSGSIPPSRSREDLEGAAAASTSAGRTSPAPSFTTSSSITRPSSRSNNHHYTHSEDGSSLPQPPSEAQHYYQGQENPASRKTVPESSSVGGRRPSIGPRPPSLVKSRSSSSLRPTRPPIIGDAGASPEAPLPPTPAQASSIAARGLLPLPGPQQSSPAPDNRATTNPLLPGVLPSSRTPPLPSSGRTTTPPPSDLPSAFSTPPRSTLRPMPSVHNIPLPPVPLGPDDAPLEALKKADPLARRASKRFSQYTYNKMTASGSMSAVGSPASTSTITMPSSKSTLMERDDSAKEFVNTLGRMDASTSSLPSPSSSGHGIKEKVTASGNAEYKKSLKGKSSSPRSDLGDSLEPLPTLTPFNGLPELSFSPNNRSVSAKKRVSMVKEETEDQLGAENLQVEPETESTPTVRAQARLLNKSTQAAETRSSLPPQNDITSSGDSSPSQHFRNPSTPVPPPIRFATQASSSPILKSQTIYLQFGRDVKKAQLELFPQPSIASLRMLFTDRFAYNPGLADFPAIYLRDPLSGVQYELEDVQEIKEHSVLSLNIEPLDQVKHHIDEGMAALAKDLKDLKASLQSARRNSNTAAPTLNLDIPAQIPLVSPIERLPPLDSQYQSAAQQVMHIERKESPILFRSEDQQKDADTKFGTTSQIVSSSAISDDRVSRLAQDLKSSFNEVQSVRRDVGILRQVYLDFKSETANIFSTLRIQSDQVKDLANTKVAGSRAFIDTGKTKLDSRSQELLTRIEELQDNIDDLKNDVTTRRIKPKPKHMETIKSSIISRQAELVDLSKYIATVKPMWKKTWEAELQNIVEEQQLLNHQEELLADLKADHENVVTIFDQIQQYVSLRLASSGRKTDFRPPSPEIGHGGLRTVLLEVKGLAPASDDRMKAIERAEKARQIEAAGRTDEFASELNGFVEGRLLKRTGGAEETERIRQLKSEATLKAMFVQSPAPPSTAPALAAAPGADVEQHRINGAKTAMQPLGPENL